MSSILLTGFPGFLGTRLLPQLLRARPEDTAVCIVQPEYMDLARRRALELVGSEPSLDGRIRLREGDISLPGLGLGAPDRLIRATEEVFHLAAVYDLSVGRELATRVNVDGTVHLLDFAEGCPSLRRIHYVSTCYVSGRHPGVFRESDLDVGQAFNNHYEETKYLAEVEVQSRMGDGLPVTIYRPSVVVGDSQTGSTQKYDGPYFVIQLLLRQPSLALLPLVGDPHSVRFNTVPRDFVVDAITHLAGVPHSVGKVYHLADPSPPTVDQILTALTSATGRKAIRIPLPHRLARWSTAHVPGVFWLTRIPAEALAYFTHPTLYSTEETRLDLKGSGITPPNLMDYLDILVAFVKEHPEIGSEAMA